MEIDEPEERTNTLKSSVGVEDSNQTLLTPFDEAEAKVLNILKITEITIDELNLVPECDYNKLNELSQSFLQSVFDIQASLKALPESESASTTSNLNELYLLQKKLEQLKSQKARNNDP